MISPTTRLLKLRHSVSSIQQIPDAVELQVGRYIWKGYPSHMARQTKQPDTKDARYVEVKRQASSI